MTSIVETNGPRRRWPLVLVAPLVSLLCAGCSMMDRSPESPFAFLRDEPEYVTPQKVIPVWSDTVLHQAGRPGTRGCGGRVLFYGINEQESVQVDGTLIVYAWDDTSESITRKPDRKYVFRADEFQDHYSRSRVGHSYSFWIPWDNAGGPRRQLTLVARFIGRNGAEVQSTPAKVILAGPVPMPEKPIPPHGDTTATVENATGVAGVESGVKLASFAEKARASVDPDRRTRMKSSEIEMTEGFLMQSLSRVPPTEVQDGYTADELFGTSPVSATDDSTVNDEETLGDEESSPESPNSLFPPEPRSSRFPPRAQRTRESRQSVGHGQSVPSR